MAKKLRWRFILVTMISVVAVLGTIIASINISNYVEINDDADYLLDLLCTGDGFFAGYNDTMTPPAEGERPRPNLPNGERNFDFAKRGLSEETHFETRYFTVRYLDDGRFVINTNQIAAVTVDEALSMADEVKTKKKTYGNYGNYRYKVDAERDMVVFVDCTRQRATADVFLATSLYVSLGGVLAVFILVFFLSKATVAPIIKAYEGQKRFITEASHELKTPLTIISANNELQELESGETQSTVAIDKQVKRMTQMVKNMVSLSRLDEAEQTERSAFPIADCLAEQVDSLRTALQSEGRSLQCDIAEGVTYVGNEDLIRQLFSIVLENANKYAQTHTRVSLVKGKKTVITVANDADLADGDMSRCFERFYRAPSARAATEGSGIGLAIAKQIVDLHHGTIAAQAIKGEFVLTITL